MTEQSREDIFKILAGLQEEFLGTSIKPHSKKDYLRYLDKIS